MEWIYRELSGIILDGDPQASAGDLISINSLPNPPLKPLGEKDVYIRRCRLAGDAIDAGFGRFRSGDLPRLLELTQGAPALVGHRKDTLGVGRFFGGEVTTDASTGISYIMPKLYWMRAHSLAEDLRVNIDGGIYNEMSLGFTFKLPTCSVCGGDIRRCDHIPGKDYNGVECYFYYDEVQRVTEGSLVYRGAQPGTGFMLGTAAGYIPGLNSMPKFKLGGVWYVGFPDKLIVRGGSL